MSLILYLTSVQPYVSTNPSVGNRLVEIQIDFDGNNLKEIAIIDLRLPTVRYVYNCEALNLAIENLNAAGCSLRERAQFYYDVLYSGPCPQLTPPPTFQNFLDGLVQDIAVTLAQSWVIQYRPDLQPGPRVPATNQWQSKDCCCVKPESDCNNLTTTCCTTGNDIVNEGGIYFPSKVLNISWFNYVQSYYLILGSVLPNLGFLRLLSHADNQSNYVYRNIYKCQGCYPEDTLDKSILYELARYTSNGNGDNGNGNGDNGNGDNGNGDNGNGDDGNGDNGNGGNGNGGNGVWRRKIEQQISNINRQIENLRKRVDVVENRLDECGCAVNPDNGDNGNGDNGGDKTCSSNVDNGGDKTCSSNVDNGGNKTCSSNGNSNVVIGSDESEKTYNRSDNKTDNRSDNKCNNDELERLRLEVRAIKSQLRILTGYNVIKC
ncbi:Hypothetical protein ORPV_1144 [Orpheovirus IHUMI-LCC2]|uniref:Uncharacterized protein n=1 Tax=Orpheovirus IHUMI-LCC2 TaxID=2023057 RepID=A0A2I2L671_9VIRU|nr:Hypothetical protein ORPV_1144 [Orpheovirus IHUMI-LCC2]SNW63048.1 Hypothetical protein ORPV_1144 [Orpheovirus IHUMI-LCC2]